MKETGKTFPHSLALDVSVRDVGSLSKEVKVKPQCASVESGCSAHIRFELHLSHAVAASHTRSIAHKVGPLERERLVKRCKGFR